MSTAVARSSSSSSVAGKIDGRAREFFWGITLSKDKPEYTWSLKEEDDDVDFLEHTLFLRHAVLGTGCTDGERNLVCIETQDYSGAGIKQPLFSLTAGKMDMCQLDINFGSEQPVTFNLIDGSGPVHLSAQQLVEFPPEDLDDTETEYTATEDEELTEEGDSVDDEGETKGKKRKASSDQAAKKKKKGERSSTEDDEEDEEDEEEDESMEEEDEESETSSPDKKGKKGAKGKPVGKLAKKAEAKGAAAKKGGKKK